MSRIRTHARSAIIGVVALASLAALPAAQAYTGDWAVSGEFERTTAPNFAGGFNPNDIDKVDATFNNRSKQLSLRLAYFEAPSRGNVYVSLGTGLADGTCNTGTLDVSIASRDITSTREVTETERYWVPSQERYTWSYSWPGTSWGYAGFD